MVFRQVLASPRRTVQVLSPSTGSSTTDPVERRTVLPQVLPGFRNNRVPPSTCVSRTHRESSFPRALAEIRPTQSNGGSGHAGLPFPDAGSQGAAGQEVQCLPSRIKLEDCTRWLPPFGNHDEGCWSAQNGKLEDWVSDRGASQRSFHLSVLQHRGFRAPEPLTIDFQP